MRKWNVFGSIGTSGRKEWCNETSRHAGIDWEKSDKLHDIYWKKKHELYKRKSDHSIDQFKLMSTSKLV